MKQYDEVDASSNYVRGPFQLDAHTAPPAQGNRYTPHVPQFTVEAAIAAMKTAARIRLAVFANQRGYDTIDTLVSYMGDDNPQWHSEATEGKLKRSQMWATHNEVAAKLRSGEIRLPSPADCASHLPTIEWETPAAQPPQ